jgi:hypothetical protein
VPLLGGGFEHRVWVEADVLLRWGDRVAAQSQQRGARLGSVTEPLAAGAMMELCTRAYYATGDWAADREPQDGDRLFGIAINVRGDGGKPHLEKMGGAVNSDPDLLDAFRRQCLTAIRPRRLNDLVDRDKIGLVFLAWLGQPGVTRDDLMDVVKEISADPDPLRNCWPKQRRTALEEMTGDIPPG